MADTHSFSEAVFGSTGLKVRRLGLSGTYRPGSETIRHAFDQGINFFFAYGFDGQTMRTMRDLFATHRKEIVVATGAYNLIIGYPNLRRSLEKRLRQLGTDYLDVFLFLGVMKEKQLPPAVIEEMVRFQEEGKVRAIGISCHDRKLLGRLAEDSPLNALMIRYNAAHRGAEQDIFPYLTKRDPGLVSYTATRWGYLLRRPSQWPKDRPVPTAAQCYRFVLSNEHVDVCLTAPANRKQLDENIAALEAGPLSEEELSFMREFGDVVHNRKRWFM